VAEADCCSTRWKTTAAKSLKTECTPRRFKRVTNEQWLISKKTFSFGEFYDPEKMQFGA
jgi:hypothetical protein